MPTTVTPASSATTRAAAAATTTSAASPLVHLRLLGETAIDVDGVPVGPESQVLFALLLVLALERGRRLSRTALHRLLWPAADDESGRHNLRQVLYKLRQLGVPVDATQSSIMLPAAAVTGELVALTSGDDAAGARVAGGRRLGDFLPGYAPSFSAPFADWLDEQRALVQAQLRRALLATLAAARGLGQWREVEATAREVLRLDPLNEEATLALAEATALAGAKAQALGIIDRYLDEVGGRTTDIRLPATVLRRRIAERFPTHRYVSAADACFAGRAAEMATLLGLWQRARERRGSAALLWGEPGIGKTRLAHELGRVATLQGAQVQRVASRSWDVERPLGAIVDLVPGLRELPGAAGVDPRCNAHLDRLTKHEPDRPLADVPDPATLHREVRQAVFDLVDALLAEAPLVLVFEDVQWLDASSWEVLAELLRLARTRRLLLVLTSRVSQPSRMPESADWEALRRIRLDGIDAAATNELLDAMTREAGRYIDPDYREWCVPLANGNPLHAQEIALQWLEKGSVREAPGSLRAMMENRIRRLSASARLLANVVALIESADPEVLEETGLFDAQTIVCAVEELSALRFCDSEASSIALRHPVFAELIQESLSREAQQLLHRTIACALERLGKARGDVSSLWSAAHHWSKSGYDDGAFNALLRCALVLTQVGLPAQAVAIYNLAEPLARSESAALALLSAKAVALAQDDQWTAVTALWATQRLLDTSAAATPSGPALLCLLEGQWRQHADVSPLIDDALALACSRIYDGNTRLKAATLALILADNCDGQLERYLACRSDITALLEDSTVSRLEAHRHLMIAELAQCRALKSAQHAKRMLQHVDGRTRPYDTSSIRQAAYALRHGGLLEDAEVALLRALDLAHRDASLPAQQQCYVSLASLALYQQDVAAARRWCERVSYHGGFSQNEASQHAFDYTVAQIAATEGDTESLIRAAERMGDPARQRGNYRRQLACATVELRACIQQSSRPSAQTDSLIRCCMQLLERYQHRGTADFAISTCCRALTLMGNHDQAVELLETFVGSYRLEQCAPHADLAQLLAAHAS